MNLKSSINLFFLLLVPTAVLVAICTLVYFMVTNDFEFSKSLKLSILLGTIFGIGLSLLVTLVLFIIDQIKTVFLIKGHTKSSEFHENSSLVKNKSLDHKFLLTMDPDLAFEVCLYAITDQKIGKIKKHTKTTKERNIEIQSEDEDIRITIAPLTKHTSRLTLHTYINSLNAKRIISYVKQQEYSLMQY
ncbi:MAG: hypothetical protein IE885_05620 [Campylobacterales bacterium]|nr:hypothetical protein [Campylobacterales bacterium]